MFKRFHVVSTQLKAHDWRSTHPGQEASHCEKLIMFDFIINILTWHLRVINTSTVRGARDGGVRCSDGAPVALGGGDRWRVVTWVMRFCVCFMCDVVCEPQEEQLLSTASGRLLKIKKRRQIADFKWIITHLPRFSTYSVNQQLKRQIYLKVQLWNVYQWYFWYEVGTWIQKHDSINVAVFPR